MDRDKQVGPMLTRQLHAFAQADEIITGAGKHGPHSRLGVDLALQAARDLQGDLLLLGLVARTAGPGVVAAVTGVNRHHNVTCATQILGGLGHPRLAGGLDRVQIDHQPVPITCVRFQCEGLGTHCAREIKHDPQASILTWRMTNTA